MTKQRYIHIILTYIPIAILFLVSTHTVFAVTCTPGTLCSPLKVTTIDGFLKAAFSVVMKLGVIVISIAIVFVGFQFIIAQGNETKLKTAKNNALFTVIGAALVLGAWVITTILSDTVNQLAT